MELGYSITSRHPADRPARTVGRQLLDRARAADEAGYDYVQAGDVLAGGYRGWPADAEWVLAGSVEDVRADLDRLCETADEIAIRPMTGEHAVETLELVAEAAGR